MNPVKKILSLDDILTLLRKYGMLPSQSKMPHLKTSSQKHFETFSIHLEQINEKSVFIAYPGVSFDKHKLLAQAFAQGCKLAICENSSLIPKGFEEKCLIVTSARKAWSFLLAHQWSYPHEKMLLVGITGTNGKSSTVWMLKELFEKKALSVISIGTLGIYLGKKHLPNPHTTPDPDILFEILAKGLNEGIKIALMEVSSHALLQEKLGPILFDALGFTSFSRDHMDLHKTSIDYAKAKLKLFEHTKKNCVSFVHGQVKKSYESLGLFELQNYQSYGKDPAFDAFIKIEDQDLTQQLSQIQLRWQGEITHIKVNLIVDFLIENFALAYLISSALIRPSKELQEEFQIAAIPGRMEAIFEKPIPGLAFVFVDFAHTPDGLEKALLSLKNQFTDKKIAVVFGCGGDRDKGKRPLMGAIAQHLSDLIILTSDNPRTEDPEIILDDIQAGFIDKKSKKIFRIKDRKEAIEFSLKTLDENWAILIAGKGHEDYQIIGKEKFAFSDQKIAKDYSLFLVKNQ